jgi:hypothetical protein
MWDVIMYFREYVMCGNEALSFGDSFDQSCSKIKNASCKPEIAGLS